MVGAAAGRITVYARLTVPTSSVRATLIPAVTIPVSLIGAFFFLYVLGFSINVLSLLGIVLAVGL
ncbi:MAG: efflux RND transporter permease subunit, partial [Bradyrhizobium sp.]|nr:efflux RND transporter permease subunit [Bradyrhizobium sp.]